MYNNRIFCNGVHSVLLIRWKLRCETPLVIRNGLSIGYTEANIPKSRGLNLEFRWEEETAEEHAVSILHFGYEVNDSSVSTYHFVPPSSVRGVLRSWTLNHLVNPDFLSCITPPPQGNKILLEKYLEHVRSALAERRNGYQLVASLFGLALNTQDTTENLGNAGRLQLETDKFQTEAQPIMVNGSVNQGEVGPGNVNRQMTVRNPLDRLTHASKDGGLHHFLEFCPGESFTVRISILNPQGSDIGLINLWRRELDDGLLRLGALSNIGRGRVKVIEPSYTLWIRPGAPAPDGFEHFTAIENTPFDDALADLWQEYTLLADKLSNFETYLKLSLR